MRSSGHLRYTKLAEPASICNLSMYSAKFVTLKLFWFSSPESSLIDEVRKFLLHELVDLFNSFVETFLRRAGDVEV